MLVVTRFAVPAADVAAFERDALAAIAALRERPGFVSGRLGRATDDPDTWLLLTEWESVGAYRRSLSGYDVKLHATPLLARAVVEPSAFEVLFDTASGAVRESDRAADAGEVRVGEASGPAREPRH